MWYVVAVCVGFLAGRLVRAFTWPLRRDLGALPLTLERRAQFHDASPH